MSLKGGDARQMSFATRPIVCTIQHHNSNTANTATTVRKAESARAHPSRVFSSSPRVVYLVIFACFIYSFPTRFRREGQKLLSYSYTIYWEDEVEYNMARV